MTIIALNTKQRAFRANFSRVAKWVRSNGATTTAATQKVLPPSENPLDALDEQLTGNISDDTIAATQ